MLEIQQLSRDDINEFPRFFNLISARMWLKDKYGKSLVLKEVGYQHNNKIYFYHYVKDQKRYLEWLDRKAKFESFDHSIYADTFQELEIREDGKLKATL